MIYLDIFLEKGKVWTEFEFPEVGIGIFIVETSDFFMEFTFTNFKFF